MGRRKKDPRRVQEGYADGNRTGVAYRLHPILGRVEDVRSSFNHPCWHLFVQAAARNNRIIRGRRPEGAESECGAKAFADLRTLKASKAGLAGKGVPQSQG